MPPSQPRSAASLRHTVLVAIAGGTLLIAALLVAVNRADPAEAGDRVGDRASATQFAKGPRIVVKAKRVRPGAKVRAVVKGFPSRERVRLQFGVYSQPPANCCASKPHPGVKKPGIRTSRKGKLVEKVRLPKRYAQCVGAGCSSPGWKRYKPGQRIYLSVSGTRSGAYAQDLMRVKGRKGGMGGKGGKGGKGKPKVDVRQDRIRRGKSIRVAGRGWPSGKSVQLAIGEPRSEAYPVAAARASRSGRFALSVGPIRAQPGRYVLLACRPSGSCRKKAKDSFRVVPAR